jgi:diguanylate cyclase (GGDEF)-like protein/PAS domain S-box-containing protein
MTAPQSGLVIVDAHNVVVFTNTAAEEMLGANVSELVIHPDLEFPWCLAHKDRGLLFSRENQGPSVAPFPGTVAIVANVDAGGRNSWCSLNVDSMHSRDGVADVTVLHIQRLLVEKSAADRTGPLAASLAAMGQAVTINDPEGKIIFWNKAAAKSFGRTAENAVGSSITSLMTPTVAGVGQSQVAELTATDGLGWSGEVMARRGDGSAFLTSVSHVPVFDDVGSLIAEITVSNDTDDEPSSATPVSAQPRGPGLVRGGTYTQDLDGTIETWSPGAEELFGYPAEAIVGRNVTVLEPGAAPGEWPHPGTAAGEAAVAAFETVRRRRDGVVIGVLQSSSPLFDDEGAVVGAAIAAQGTSRRLNLESALKRAATHDPVTGLPNRRFLNELLEHELARATSVASKVAVILLQIDEFKIVNYARGYSAGDELLAQFADRMLAVIRPADILGRFGNAEFAILCIGMDSSETDSMADRVHAALESPFSLRGENIYLSATIGLASSPPFAANAQELLTQADAAMVKAQSLGSYKYSAWDMGLASQSKARLDLKNDIRLAFAGETLDVHYQPTVDFTTGLVIGIEALIRWNHPALGWVPRSVFLPLAAQARLTAALDGWTVRQSLRDAALLRAWGVLDPDAKIRIGISAVSILDRSFAGMLGRELKASRVPPEVVELGLAEPGSISQRTGAIAAMDAIGQLGIGLLLNDLGTSRAEMSMARHPAVSTVRVSEDFARGVLDNAADLAIATSLIGIARAMDLQVLADGVSRFDQLALLHRLGCDAGQGELWSPPLPRDELAALLRREPRAFEVEGEDPAVSRRRARMTNEHGLHRLTELHREGASPTTIAAALNAESYQTPQRLRWHSTSVARALTDLKPAPNTPAQRRASDH